MNILLHKAKQVLTCKPENGKFKRKSELNDLNLIEDASIIIDDDKIYDITKCQDFDFSKFDLIIECSDKILMPGLIDSHTHLIFAGSRADEFEMRVEGKSYEEISQKGGGIVRTVDATRKATREELLFSGIKRLDTALSLGVTTIEIKSGYGLDYDNELKILECIEQLRKFHPIEIVSTFLGAHAIPNEYKNNRQAYTELITQKLLPKISHSKLAEFCDVFLEKTAFSVEESSIILQTAKEYNFSLKLHCDQFNSMGGVELGINLGVKSVDHLEVITDSDIKKLSQTDIVATVLPGVSYFLKIPYSPARKMIDDGCIVALATDFNPGSCTSLNLPLMMNIATLYNGMKLNETINSATINAAYALGLENRIGSLEIGKQADVIILDTIDYRNLVYYFGQNPVQTVIKKGKVVYAGNN